MNALHDLGLLSLSDDAELLHCSKAHVCKAVCGMLDRRRVFPAVLFNSNLACSVTAFMASDWKKVRIGCRLPSALRWCRSEVNL